MRTLRGGEWTPAKLQNEAGWITPPWSKNRFIEKGRGWLKMKLLALSLVIVFALVNGFTSGGARHHQVQRMSMTAKVVIGTRGSPLALAQAYETQRLLRLNFPELREEGAVEIKKIMTKVSKLMTRHFFPLLAGWLRRARWWGATEYGSTYSLELAYPTIFITHICIHLTLSNHLSHPAPPLQPPHYYRVTVF